MNNVEELRRLALAADCFGDPWPLNLNNTDRDFIAAASPATVLALLDRLAAAEAAVAEAREPFWVAVPGAGYGDCCAMLVGGGTVIATVGDEGGGNWWWHAEDNHGRLRGNYADAKAACLAAYRAAKEQG